MFRHARMEAIYVPLTQAIAKANVHYRSAVLTGAGMFWRSQGRRTLIAAASKWVLIWAA